MGVLLGLHLGGKLTLLTLAIMLDVPAFNM